MRIPIGAFVMGAKDGREVTLHVEPDTVIVHADKRVIFSQMGNDIMVRATPVTVGGLEQAYSVILTTP